MLSYNNILPVSQVSAVVISGVLGREQLLVGYQCSWLPCCGFASQFTQELCVSHPQGWDPSCTSLIGHQGWHSALQNPHLVSGRTHGGGAAGKGEPALIVLLLPYWSALQRSLTAQRTPHSPFAASPDFICPSLLFWLNPCCLTPQSSCGGVFRLTMLGCQLGVPQPHGSSASGGFCCQVARQHFSIYLHAWHTSLHCFTPSAVPLWCCVRNIWAQLVAEQSPGVGSTRATCGKRLVPEPGWWWQGGTVVTTPARGVGAQQPLGIVSLAANPAGWRAGRARTQPLPWSGSFWRESGKLWPFIVELEQEVGEVKQVTLWWSLCSSHLSCFSPLAPQGFIFLS